MQLWGLASPGFVGQASKVEIPVGTESKGSLELEFFFTILLVK